MSRELPWLKWYPEKAQASFRWRSLTLAERGLFHDLYDIAAMSPVRGQLVTPCGPISDKDLADAVGVDKNTFGALLAHLLDQHLIVRNLAETLVFPDFSRHQRNGPLRSRGADLAQDLNKNGALEVDVEVEEEVEVEVETTGAPRLPAVLQRREFRAIWAEWLMFRSQNRYKAYKDISLTRLWNKFARWADQHGIAYVVEAIESSIENNYQGIFPPKGNGAAQGGKGGTGKAKPTGRTYRPSTQHQA